MAKSRRSEKKKGHSVVSNKKAYRNFELLEKFEAGLQLLGSEVKSLRAGQADLGGSYAKIENGQCWLVGANVSAYQQGGMAGHEPARKRKLLLHKTEIHKIRVKLEQRGFTFVPLRIFFNEKGLAKIELALARGKRKYDKRSIIDERTRKHDIDRDMKKYRRR